jgi:hypothetical protein
MEEGDDPTVGVQSEPEFPGYTKWEYTRFCCFANAIRTLPNNVIFLGHWEVSFGFPILVYFIIVSSYLVAMLLIFPYRLADGRICSIAFSILFFIFCYCYARTIIDGPGYFPFYYPSRSPRHSQIGGDSSPLLHSDDLSPSGILSTPEQTEWIKSQPRPNRCIYSSVARRIVIRPDHFCGWTSTWIGKRNHKFFLLFNFWGCIYIFTFSVFAFLRVHEEAASISPSPVMGVYIVYIFLSLMFLMLTGSFVATHMVGTCRNVTSWEAWNYIEEGRFDRGFIKNIEDVCGPSQQWYQCLLPISPWTEVSNDQFVMDYPTYGERSRKGKQGRVTSFDA